ncbi:hypothetical protein M378DRAFT_70617 [Amanita muscaria Koide BX008]|uniref:Potassium transport protein n=1 Tax=Amanita muscaria (strain Koide BX008) TaxID=946122 RepID=A0A0C2XIE6_AMAMK|nr:hypothetical protein M378DRAFT_70617 [Amanita muscaria Koide BX008]
MDASATRWTQCRAFSVGQFLRRNLNFYRIHILVFTFTPLIFSGIFYASNGGYKVSYIDSLFSCVSAMTVCGLSTVDLSGLTPWQQVILFIQMCLGSPVLVSWVMVYTRKYYFAKKFKYIIDASHKLNVAPVSSSTEGKGWRGLFAFLTPKKQSGTHEAAPQERHNVGSGLDINQRLTPEMIRRLDAAPKLVNPSGRVSEMRLPSPRRAIRPYVLPEHGRKLSIEKSATLHGDELVFHPSVTFATSPSSRHVLSVTPRGRKKLFRSSSDPGTLGRHFSLRQEVQRSENVEVHPQVLGGIGARTQTIEFAPISGPLRRRRGRDGVLANASGEASDPNHKLPRRSSVPRLPRAASVHHATTPLLATENRYREFGGFPTPLEILRRVANRFFPSLNRRFRRTVTVPRTMSLVSNRAGALPGTKVVPYISFDAIVGRNSMFHRITSEQRDELGGTEYRALKALLWIIGAYHVVIQCICFTVIAPYISQPRWARNFVPPQLLKPINPVWFSAFQVVSAYTNTGTSLVDQSMIPFQTAYPMVVLMIFLILAGNTCFVFLVTWKSISTIRRWIITKCVPDQSRSKETLHFLLDHPRRCFIYLFPSHQTWFLLTIMLLLNFIDWFFFLVLDIGNAALTQISFGLRVLIGFLQASAVRAAGFSVVSIAALAPAVKVLYVITMYISVYPIALSVRSTNVYEERSLGVFDDDNETEGEFDPSGSRIAVWGKYLALHARKQLAFDMWWLATALFLICIIEQDSLINPDNATWFNVFNIIFEIVSAYGSVGLSTGLPFANYSLSGAFRPLSKLIVCLVMIRGRHRGLPVAIDRAVLLPSEFKGRGEAARDENENASGPVAELRGRYPISHGASPRSSIVQTHDSNEVDRQ